MNNYMDIEDIKEKYDNGGYKYRPYHSIPAKVGKDYVFDENLSVSKNRELVAEHNQKVDAEIKEVREKNAALMSKLTEDVVTYIANTYNMTEFQARTIEAYVYAHNHDFMIGYFDKIDEIAQLVECVLENGNE